MSDDRAGLETGGSGRDGTMSLQALTGEILPALVARLRASRLGELEVRSDGWRVRLRRDPAAFTRAAAGAGADPATAEVLVAAGGVARSPAVGYFSPAAELTVGLSVQAGDLLGTIDVLGIAQEVTASTDGIVANVLAEDGQAVEYGQPLVDIDPLEMEVESDEDGDGTGA